jgi:hypothetical protein
MEFDERAKELEREAERLEHESKRMDRQIESARSDWESKKSDVQAPGAQSAEAAGPHNIDAEDPATGRKYGQEDRREELESALEQDESSEEAD